MSYIEKLNALAPTFEQVITEYQQSDKLQKRLAKYQLSVSHLNGYLNCPVSYYFDYLVRVPAPLHPAMTYGSAVHHALEHYFRQMQATENFPEVEVMHKLFLDFIEKNKSAFDDLDAVMERGVNALNGYYANGINVWNKIVSIERNIRGVDINGRKINGKLDKIEFDGYKCIAVDYKTGKFDPESPRFARPDFSKNFSLNDKENFGGNYWRQGVFYKILVDNYQAKSWKVKNVRFEYVEPDEVTGMINIRKQLISEEEINFVKAQICEVFDCIVNSQFENGCEWEECFWCNYAKANPHLKFKK